MKKCGNNKTTSQQKKRSPKDDVYGSVIRSAILHPALNGKLSPGIRKGKGREVVLGGRRVDDRPHMGTTGEKGAGPIWLESICWWPMSKLGQQEKINRPRAHDR